MRRAALRLKERGRGGLQETWVPGILDTGILLLANGLLAERNMLLAQSLGEYGLREGLRQGMARLRAWADPWMDEWGFVALALGGIVVVGWVVLKMLGR